MWYFRQLLRGAKDFHKVFSMGTISSKSFTSFQNYRAFFRNFVAKYFLSFYISLTQEIPLECLPCNIRGISADGMFD